MLGGGWTASMVGYPRFHVHDTISSCLERTARNDSIFLTGVSRCFVNPLPCPIYRKLVLGSLMPGWIFTERITTLLISLGNITLAGHISDSTRLSLWWRFHIIDSRRSSNEGLHMCLCKCSRGPEPTVLYTLLSVQFCGGHGLSVTRARYIANHVNPLCHVCKPK